MNHSVPEQMFSTEENPVQGISAVKALALAGAQGQKIWTVNQDNLTVALNSINLNSDIETEIRNAVNAGKIATVHESPVAFAGGTNVGYILLDPETGAGAYKIAGGVNGGALFGLITGLLQALALFFVMTPLIAAIVGIAVLITSVILALTEDNTTNLEFQAARLFGILGGFGLVWILGGFVMLSIPFLFSLGFIFLVFTVLRLITVEALYGFEKVKINRCFV